MAESTRLSAPSVAEGSRVRLLRATPALLQLWVGAGLGAVCAFAAQMLLARTLSAQQFGEFSAALGTVVLISPLAGFGIAPFWLRAFGEEGWTGLRWISPSLRFSSVSTAAVVGSLFGCAAMGIGTPATDQLLVILSPLIVAALFIEIVNGKLQLEDRFGFLGVWQLAPSLGRLLVIILAIYTLDTSHIQTAVALGYSGVGLGLCVVGVMESKALSRGQLRLRGHGEQPKQDSILREPPIEWRKVARESWPYGAATLFYLLLTQSSVVVLALVAQITESGYFSIVLTVLAAIYLLPNVLYQKFLLPKIHRWAHQDRNSFYANYRMGNWLMLALGIAAAALVLMGGPAVLLSLFGAKYAAVVVPLRLAAISIPFRFVSMSVGAVLVTQEHMRLKVAAMGAVGALHLIGCVSLGRMYGASGAAVALVIGEVILLASYHHLVRVRVFNTTHQSLRHA